GRVAEAAVVAELVAGDVVAAREPQANSAVGLPNAALALRGAGLRIWEIVRHNPPRALVVDLVVDDADVLGRGQLHAGPNRAHRGQPGPRRVGIVVVVDLVPAHHVTAV